MPLASSMAASRGARTPLRLAGEARHFVGTLFLALVVFHLFEHRVRDAFAREEDEADTDADAGFDRLQADAECDALGIRHAVVDERERDRDLHEPEFPGPGREDRRAVDSTSTRPAADRDS